MSTNKAKVLARYPKAHCYMSQLSGVFFVKKGDDSRSEHSIIGYQPSAQAAWKDAATRIAARSANKGKEEKP